MTLSGFFLEFIYHMEAEKEKRDNQQKFRMWKANGCVANDYQN